jgi:acetyl esterase/lipase
VAPEDPFPVALEGVEDLILQVLKQSDRHDPHNVALSGFSAGANLALAAASNSESDIPKDSIRAILAFYPAFNLPAQKKAPDGSSGTIPQLSQTSSMIRTCRREWIGQILVFPCCMRIRKVFLSNVLIFACGKDNLAGEAEELAAKSETAGRKVTLRRVENVEHGWDKTTNEDSNDAKERDDAYNLAISFLSNLK